MRKARAPGILIGRGVATRIPEYPDNVLIQVQGAANEEAAFRALAVARLEIADLDGGWSSAPGLGPQDRNNPPHVSTVDERGEAEHRIAGICEQFVTDAVSFQTLGPGHVERLGRRASWSANLTQTAATGSSSLSGEPADGLFPAGTEFPAPEFAWARAVGPTARSNDPAVGASTVEAVPTPPRREPSAALRRSWIANRHSTHRYAVSGSRHVR